MSNAETYPFTVRALEGLNVLDEGSDTWEMLHRRFPGLLQALAVPPKQLVRGRTPPDSVPWSFELLDHGEEGKLLCKRRMNAGQPLGSGEAVKEVVVQVPVVLLAR